MNEIVLSIGEVWEGPTILNEPCFSQDSQIFHYIFPILLWMKRLNINATIDKKETKYEAFYDLLQLWKCFFQGIEIQNSSLE